MTHLVPLLQVNRGSSEGIKEEDSIILCEQFSQCLRSAVMVRMVKMLRCPTSSTSSVNWIILSAVLCALVNTIGCFKLLLLFLNVFFCDK